MDKVERKLSEGEYRVGVDFNPSGNRDVAKFKALAAELIDMLEPIFVGGDHPGARCAAIARTEIENAAMWGVKAFTKKPR